MAAVFLPADKLLLDVGAVAQLLVQQQQQQLQLHGSGEPAAVPDCDVCGDDPAKREFLPFLWGCLRD
jgi:hypothetical protein